MKVVIDIFKNRNEVENYIYKSYMRAVKNIDKNLPDKDTRNPQLTKKILNLLGDPDLNQKNIMVTGSKGKGSVSRIIAKLLEAHGYKIGLFTSPHLIKFNERIRINGIAISDDDLIKYADEIKSTVDSIESKLPNNIYIGPLGITVVIAMLYFKDNKTDFNIIECGKGARYDDVAFIESDISVINNIFLEHVPQLGNTISEVAYNKSGVIKRNHKAVFTSNQHLETIKIIEENARELSVPLKKYGDDFVCKNISISTKGTKFDVKTKKNLYPNLELKLLGSHQAYNATLSLGVCEELVENIDLNKVKKCFSNLTWPGRLEIVNYKPLTIIDGCINRESTKYVKEIIDNIKKSNIILIVGIPDDKDYYGVVDEFKNISYKIIATRTKNQYMKFTNNQNEVIYKLVEDKFIFIENLKDSIDYAYKSIKEDELLLVLGTQSLIRETKEYFKQATTDLD
ncbi:MAG: Mur ligase family protein [Clostridiales bacterium]